MPSALPSLLTKEDLMNETNSQLLTGGINFSVEYVGSIPIGISMNSINQTEQNKVSRACIVRVLLAAKRLPGHPESSAYSDYFNEKPDVFNKEVDMNISSSSVMIIQGRVLQKFPIQDVSLVVPGSHDLGKYFCLIANVKTGGNNEMPRRCFVFFANSEMLEVYKTIVSAFHVCAQQMGLSQEPKPVPKTRSSVSRDKTPTPPSISTTPSTSKNLNQFHEKFNPIAQLGTSFSDASLCETRAGKKRVPSRSSSRSPLSSASSSKSIIYAVSTEGSDELNTPHIRVESSSPNGISMHAPPPLPPRSRNNSAIITTPTNSPQRNELIRRSVPITKQTNRQPKSRDLSSTACQRERAQSMAVNITQQAFEDITRNLNFEPWFHGKLSRAAAEAFIVDNGQFLVRQSPNIHGQIVLSGMQDKIVKHICLVDQEGFLRTSEGEFHTVSNLIKYYYQNRHPVTSDSSELTLIEPVYRRNIRQRRFQN